tara:strand:+ start:2098 stop:3447 length:1350 start_codon:yes stop_codon:yes gene_type:complete
MTENIMHFDLFVIGGGSGGVRAARVASSKGKRVGLAEGWDLGGTCVNRGCIPKKLYSYSSHFLEELEVMKSFGWSVDNVNFSWSNLVRNKKKEINRLNEIYKTILENSGVRIFNCFASFKSEKIIKLNDQEVSAENVLIAVGGKPVIPEIEGSQYIISSDEAFDIEKLPNKILIVGGGYIALEFASIFNGLGVDTTICVRGDKILRGFDEEVALFLKEEMEKKGIKFMLNTNPHKVVKNSETLDVSINNYVINFDIVMAATGRRANLDLLKIHNTTVKLNENKSIEVDDFFETSNKNIFAIGDVIDRVQLTPVAIAEAMVLISNIFDKKNSFDYNYIPTAIFANPNMSSIGYSEEMAKKNFGDIEVYISKFRPLKYTLSKFDEKVFIKLVVEKKTQKVLGLHYIGADAAEIIQGFSVAILKGITKKDLDNTIGIHPSSAEEIVTLKEKR